MTCELGINRYERISAPDLKTPADEYWAATGPYWHEVRLMWHETFRRYEVFQLKASYEDMKLYEHHFRYAGKIMETGDYRPQKGRRHARTTISNFLQTRQYSPPRPPEEE